MRYIILIIGVAFLQSCKKDVKCVCRTNVTGSTGNNTAYYTTYIVKETTEKAAKKSHCADFSTEQTVDKVTTTTETTCEVKYK